MAPFLLRQAAEHGTTLSCCSPVPSPYIHCTKLASDRQNSEDRARVFERGDDLVVVVADGAGGMRGGAAASAALIEAVEALAESPTLDAHDPDHWTALLRENEATLSRARAGETTAVIVVVGPHALTGVSVGDSEAWIVTARSIDDLTRGQQTPRLGSSRSVPVPFHRGHLDGVLVVATDGLFKYASPARIAASVRAGAVSQIADRLVALVQLPSHRFQDDVGLVVVAPR